MNLDKRCDIKGHFQITRMFRRWQVQRDLVVLAHNKVVILPWVQVTA